MKHRMYYEMEELKFSVIIPIYNVEESYLRKCLNSVLEQTYKSMEVLLIIDGATDGSILVCQEYVSRDNRFRVFQRSNKGAGAARNFAIEQAGGDYIFFVDSDDYWIDPGLVEKVACLLHESHADLLSFGYIEFFKGERLPAVPVPGDLVRTEVVGRPAAYALTSLLKTSRRNFSSSIVTKCVKTSLLRENSICFLEGINGEDAHYTAQLLIHAKSYDRLNECAYAVRRHTSSTSRAAANSRRVADSMEKVFDDLFTHYNLHRAEYERVLDFLASPYLYALGKLAAAYDREILHRLAGYSFVLKCSSRRYVKLTGVFAELFGLDRLVAVLRIYLMHSRKSHVKIDKKTEV